MESLATRIHHDPVLEEVKIITLFSRYGIIIYNKVAITRLKHIDTEVRIQEECVASVENILRCP